MIDLGGKFIWDETGAYISYPHPFQTEQIRRECIINNGLPHLQWDDFKLLRVALSKQYKADQRDATAFRATAVVQPEVMSWRPEFAEPQGVKTVLDSDTVSDFAEQAAKERLQAETPITHGELLGLIRGGGLKPTAMRRKQGPRRRPAGEGVGVRCLCTWPPYWLDNLDKAEAMACSGTCQAHVI